MSIFKITKEHIDALTQNARSVYLAALTQADNDLDVIVAADGTSVPIGANATPLRAAHFMAQILHETDGLSIRIESMNYSAERMMVVWPKRFPDYATAAPYAHAPAKLAERTYGGRMGNGPEGSGDGWRFIGRGLLQITGREAYEKYGSLLGIDLAADPDLAFSAEWSLKVAAVEWAHSRRKGMSCNQLADIDEIEGVTWAINGGDIGLSSRREWLRKAKKVFGI